MDTINRADNYWFSGRIRDLANRRVALTDEDAKIGDKPFLVINRKVADGNTWVLLAEPGDNPKHILARLTPDVAQLHRDRNIVGAWVDTTRPVLRKGLNKPHPSLETTIQLPPLNLYLDVNHLHFQSEPRQHFRRPDHSSSINCLTEVKTWLKELNKQHIEKNKEFRFDFFSSSAESQSPSQPSARDKGKGRAVESSPVRSEAASYLNDSPEESRAGPSRFFSSPVAAPATQEQATSSRGDESRMDVDGDEDGAQAPESDAVDVDRTPKATQPRLDLTDSAASGDEIEVLLRPSAEPSMPQIRPSSPTAPVRSSSPARKSRRNLAVFEELPFAHYTEVKLVDIDFFASPPASPKAGPSKLPTPPAQRERTPPARPQPVTQPPIASPSTSTIKSGASPSRKPVVLELDDDEEVVNEQPTPRSQRALPPPPKPLPGKRKRATESASLSSSQRPSEPKKAKKASQVIELDDDSMPEDTAEPSASPPAEDEPEQTVASLYGWLAARLLPDLPLRPGHLGADFVQALIKETARAD